MLKGQVALVTGASRGIGRGIALQLGEAGATVYVTGRPPKLSDNKEGTVKELPTLEKTAQEVTARGGKGIAVYCDHSSIDDVKALFERIEKEQDGQLDICVNNAYSAVSDIGDNMGKKFWEIDPLAWDSVNNVGLRNHYICTVYAARLMVPRKKGLIVIVSSAGGFRYLFNVPYGVGKAACDRMAADCAHELRKDNVTVVSLWPGAVKTELVLSNLSKFGSNEDMKGEDLQKAFLNGESTEYAGKGIIHLAQDPNLLKKTGKVLLTADLGDEYGFLDVDGKKPPNMRSVSFAMNHVKMGWLASFVPGWMKVPCWVMTLAGSKF